MRDVHTRRRARRNRLAALLLVCACGGHWGCHQHHYYYNGASGMAGCPPTVTGTAIPSNVAVGPVCDVPSSVDGDEPVIIGSHSTVVDNGSSKPRVVVSKPDRRSSRFGWRSSNPEDVPVFTQVEVEGATSSKVR